MMFSLCLTSASSTITSEEKKHHQRPSYGTQSTRHPPAPYQCFSLLFPTNLEAGDLIFFDIKPLLSRFFHIHNISGFSNDHVIMYGGKNDKGQHIFIESNDYTSVDLNLRINGVQKTKSWVFFLYVHLKSITIGKVHATTDQKQQAIQFALSHLGDHYQWGWPKDPKYESWHANPVLTDPQNPYYEYYYYPDDPYYNQWTCAEFVWAAYLHQGIELDGEPAAYPDPDFNNQTFFYVGTDDLKKSENITLEPPIWG